MKLFRLSLFAAASLAIASVACAEDTPAAAPAGPTPLSTPAMSSTLAANANPMSVDAGFLGKIWFSGQLTGLATWQDHAVAGNNEKGKFDLSNAQIEIQKTDGLLQFYVQAGEYTFPSLGSAYVAPGRLTQETYKYVPVAYLKIAPNAAFNIEIGKLPTLIGAEYTFTFENMNIARGLLWNQEPAISRGVQANYTQGPLTVAVSLNDGFYSNHFTTGSALVTYVLNPKDTLAFAASGNFKKTSVSSFATPLAQNNGSIYNLIWTHTDGPWVISPYLQFSHTPQAASIGLPGPASTWGGAVLAKYSFNPMFSLAGRAEYEDSSGSQVSLLYGPKSSAWSLTLTPAWQFKTFFIRGEASYTKLGSAAPGAGFGSSGNRDSQTRAMIETGVLF
ncbi:MAG TPA: outer membrane beta-barrel protein [Phenylobacterium sp.]|nr:outer membrane beta-barrel protein [Phenylobacterium sp.]